MSKAGKTSAARRKTSATRGKTVGAARGKTTSAAHGKTISARQLGNIALAADNHPKGATPKLESVGQDVDERFFMLATFCFDLSRKLKYLCLTLKEFWKDADPEFAKRILEQNEFINPGPGAESWEEMARRAEGVMKGLWQEIRSEGFDQTLRSVAAKAR